MPMTRTCVLCNVSKTGPEAEIKDPVDAQQHTAFWEKLHLPDCPTRKMTDGQRLDHFMEHGSPVSSVEI
jgi:hypothetical protein